MDEILSVSARRIGIIGGMLAGKPDGVNRGGSSKQTMQAAICKRITMNSRQLMWT